MLLPPVAFPLAAVMLAIGALDQRDPRIAVDRGGVAAPTGSELRRPRGRHAPIRPHLTRSPPAERGFTPQVLEQRAKKPYEVGARADAVSEPAQRIMSDSAQILVAIDCPEDAAAGAGVAVREWLEVVDAWAVGDDDARYAFRLAA